MFVLLFRYFLVLRFVLEEIAARCDAVWVSAVTLVIETLEWCNQNQDVINTESTLTEPF